VGDKEIDVMDSFRFYVTTKLPNPTYTPEVGRGQIHGCFAVLTYGMNLQRFK